MKQETFTVYSSHGELIATVEDGIVQSVEIYEGSEDEPVAHIGSFDIKEWEEHYRYKIQPDQMIDILDLGYWIEAGNYEPPAQHWRDEFRSADMYNNQIKEI